MEERVREHLRLYRKQRDNLGHVITQNSKLLENAKFEEVWPAIIETNNECLARAETLTIRIETLEALLQGTIFM